MPSHRLTVAVLVWGPGRRRWRRRRACCRGPPSLRLRSGCSIFLNLMLNATGKIIHNDVVLTLCLIALVASPRAASQAWKLPTPKPQRGRQGPERKPPL